MMNSLVNGGTLVAGFLASLCCIGPLALTFLGIGGVAFATVFEPYRPYLIGITAIFLGLGFFFAYRPQKEECAPGEACATPKNRKRQRAMLWIVTALAIILVAFPYILPYLPL
ncbi:MAG: mercuric transporter MerT family protein [bacterium]